MTTTTVITEGLAFADGARWRDGRLWYSDFYRRGVYSIAPDGTGERLESAVPGQPSGLGWTPEGDLWCVSMTDHRVVRLGPEGESTVADLTAHCGFWANEMLVAPSGVAYVGDFGFDVDRLLAERGVEGLFDPPAPTTNLVVLGPDGGVRQVVPEMSFPNGTVLTPDGTTLIVAETIGGRLSAFRVGPDGTLTQRRVWAPLRFVAPDGICLDAEGQVWVANALAPQVLRVAEGGEVTAEVTTSLNAYACVLGGADARTLYVLTAPRSSRFEVAERRDARVESVRVAVAGAASP